MEIVWEDPPPPYTAKEWQVKFFEALMAEPGRWALWPADQNTPGTTNINRSYLRSLKHLGAPEGSFQARSTSNPPQFYVRYVGQNNGDKT